MKVLQINSVCGYGSTGRIVIDIQKMLIEHGHEGLIAYGRGTAPNGINSIRIGTNFDNYIHVANTRLSDRHGFSSTKATKEFIQNVRSFNPDVIHLHNIHGYYINIKLLFAFLKEYNKPIIWTLHDCWAFTGHCAYFDYVGCDKWKKECNKCPQKKAYPKSLLFDRSRKNFNSKKKLFTSVANMTIVTPSIWLSRLVKQSFLQKHAVKVINNGIDTSLFSPQDRKNFRKKYGIEDKYIILGVANIWDTRKGLNDFIKLSDHIDSNSKIVLVGLNRKQIKELPDSIIGIERTKNITDLAEIYSSADIFVNPTLEDNFPTTNLESLACGTPVITYNTGGSPESIDINCGDIAEKGDINGLLEKIEKFKHSADHSKTCAEHAQKFEKKSQYHKYIELYKEVTG